MSFLACPDGFCSFDDISLVIVGHSGWKLRNLPVKMELISQFIDTGMLQWSDQHERLVDPNLQLMAQISQYLTTGEHSASAILWNGSIVFVPPQSWRIMEWVGDRNLAAIQIAFAGGEISIPRANGSFDKGRAIISFQDLGEIFGATHPPAPPMLRPTYLPEYAPPRPEPECDEVVSNSQLARPRPTGGRPVTRDWDAFWIEVAHYAAINDLELEHRPELQRHMQEWSARESTSPMDESSIRRKLAQLYARKTG
jgi:hypothetical protein